MYLQGDGSLNGGFQQGGLNSILLQTTSNNDWIMQVVLILRPELTPKLKFVPSWLDFFRRPSWLPKMHFLSRIFCPDKPEDDSKVSKLKLFSLSDILKDLPHLKIELKISFRTKCRDIRPEVLFVYSFGKKGKQVHQTKANIMFSL